MFNSWLAIDQDVFAKIARRLLPPRPIKSASQLEAAIIEWAVILIGRKIEQPLIECQFHAWIIIWKGDVRIAKKFVVRSQILPHFIGLGRVGLVNQPFVFIFKYYRLPNLKVLKGIRTDGRKLPQ